MREIKFRAKLLFDNVWSYGAVSMDSKKVFRITPQDTIQHLLVNENTIGQYTGLKDKNGVDIYEGDIIKSSEFKYDKHNINFKGIIYWDEDYGWHVTGNAHDFLGDFMLSKLEVIGNIHENKELLG